jgi:hypothetical protein
MDGWVSLRRGDRDGALRLTEDALSMWATYGGVFPFQWLSLVPRLEAQLSAGRIADAVDSSRALLQPSQQRLPSRVEQALAAAIAAWDGADGAATDRHLGTAMDALNTHYLR